MPSASRRTTQAESGENRRRFPRRLKPFRAVYVAGGSRIPAVGLDISGGGLCLLTQQAIAPEILAELSVIALVENKPVPLTARVAWKSGVALRGKPHFRYGMRLSKIADTDWDQLMRWTLQDADPAKFVQEGTTLTEAQRDKLLRGIQQRHICAELARHGRLDPVDIGRLPLVQHKFDGYMMQDSIPMYKFTVRSKVTKDRHQSSEHRTRVLVKIDGDSVAVQV